MTDGDVFQTSDLIDIRVEQARLLRANAQKSAIIVGFIVFNTSAILALMGVVFNTVIWLVAACAMIVATIIYANRAVRGDITRHNVQRYLFGHVVMSALTGLVWSAFAILSVDTNSQPSIFIFCLLLTSITVGGLLPGSIYRPGYIALAAAILPPFGFYLLLFGSPIASFVGIAILVFFAISMLASGQNEVHIRENITARLNKEASTEIARKNVEINQLMDSKSRFVASISHDLSQPMLAQRNFIMQLNDTALGPEQVSLLEKIFATQHNQERLMQDLVDMNSPGNALKTSIRRVNLREALAALLTEFEGVARMNELTFDVELLNLEIETDPKLLSRIIRNLLSNSMKFTAAHGAVSLTSSLHEDQLCLSVKDTGIGLHKDDLPLAFEEYVYFDRGTRTDDKIQGKTQNAAGETGHGLGLGLSIARKLSDAIGAAIEISSSSDEGTIVEVVLPVKYEHEPKVRSDVASEARPNLVLVIAQDGWMGLKKLNEELSLANYATVHALHARQALQLVASIDQNPDFVLIAQHGGKLSDVEDAIDVVREEVNSDIPSIVFIDETSKLPQSNLGDVAMINFATTRWPLIQARINEMNSRFRSTLE